MAHRRVKNIAYDDDGEVDDYDEDDYEQGADSAGIHSLVLDTSSMR